MREPNRDISLSLQDQHHRPFIFTILNAGTRKLRKQRGHDDESRESWSLLDEFRNNSTVHGVKYLGDRQKHWSEKAFWVIAFLISVIGCCAMVMQIYEKWQNTPSIVEFSDRSTPIWKIPFPAVTICPETKAMKKNVDFTKGYIYTRVGLIDNLTTDEAMNLEALSQICEPQLFSGNDMMINSGLKADAIVPLLKSITVSMNESTLFCKWSNSVDSCDAFFKEVLTEEGFCYSFNLLNQFDLYNEEAIAKDFLKWQSRSETTFNPSSELHSRSSNVWTFDKGYNSSDLDVYPSRVIGPGARAGLNIVLMLTDDDLDYMCRGPVQGFKVIIHSPADSPRVSRQFFKVPLKQEVVVNINPNMITTSKGLKRYSPDKRQCYFDNEHKLKFFKIYTQQNCEIECLADFILKSCGCVKFSMPRDSLTKICEQKDIDCYDSAEDLLMLKELNSTLQSSTDENSFGKSLCGCYPTCTTINYDTEISQAEYNYTAVFDAFGADLNEFPGAILARLIINFKDSHFVTVRRSMGDEFYGLTDFMANVGGLLGLFMGVSILSLIEILYYFTLRFACHLTKKQQNENLQDITWKII